MTTTLTASAAVLASSATTGQSIAERFANDTFLVTLGKALFIFVFLVVNVLVAILAERKIIGRMQNRPGPNRAGPGGALQSLADGVKLALKEDIVPKAADKVLYIAAPAIAAVPCFLSFAVIPMAGEVEIPFTSIHTPLQLTDLPVAVLYILAVTSVGVYGLVLAGWASGSTYPLLGGVRSTAQVISYELSMGMSLVSVFIVAGSMSTNEIVESQHTFWWGLTLFPAFVIYVISMVGETNRAPFDLPEAEGELVGGFHTEYSSLKFALFFLAEYVNMVTVSALATTLFLGGWQAPIGFNQIEAISGGWWGLFWFTAKVWLFMFLFIWLRGSLPRLRYDQFMEFGWKRLIPASLVWIVGVTAIQGVQQFTDLGLRPVLLAIATAAVLVLLLSFLPFGKDDDEQADAEPEPFDAFAGGYPVPPLPGQQLPPSPRAARLREAVPAGSAPGTGPWERPATDDPAPTTLEKEDDRG